MRKFVTNLFEKEKNGPQKSVLDPEKMEQCFQKFEKFETPEHENVKVMSVILGVCVAVYGKGAGPPLQLLGDKKFPRMNVNNVPSMDGAGKEAAHFRFIWNPKDSSAGSEVEQASSDQM